MEEGGRRWKKRKERMRNKKIRIEIRRRGRRIGGTKTRRRGGGKRRKKIVERREAEKRG